MKTILSIDFDIIMAPSIDSYNDRVPRTSWERLNKEPLYQLIVADYQIYQKLTNYLMTLLPLIEQKNIHFIYDHEQIIDFLNPDEYYNIIHIDHHHDMGYGPIEEKEKELGCANWLHFVPHLLTCKWIKNDNSQTPPKEKTIKDLEILNLKSTILDTLNCPQEIYICLSPPWIPPNHRFLFYLWMDLFNKYYHTHFDFEQRRKNSG